jgi:hypothetical protein
MTQCDAILELLKRGETITPAAAYERFGILAMHSRAAELREQGYDVRCTIKTGNGRRWGEYRLVGNMELAL